MIQEIKYGGYSASPSDHEAPEGDLALALNVIPEHASIKPVLPPTREMTLPDDTVLLTIHEATSFLGKHYILQSTGSSHELSWWTGTGTANSIRTPMAVINHMQAIGNTLVALTDEGLYYFLWNGNGYTDLGQKIPEIDLSFSLKKGTASATSEQLLGNSEWSDYVNNNEELTGEKKTQYNNILCGLINKVMAEEVTGKGKFCQPFFVRYAVRLYDDSLTMHSAPVLMLPSRISCGLSPDTGGTRVTVTMSKDALECQALVPADGWSKLNNWRDLITSVDIFISAPLYVYNQAGEVDHVEGNVYWTQGIEYDSSDQHYKAMRYGANTGTGWIYGGCAYPQVEFEQWKQGVIDCQNFYLLKSLSLSELSEYATRKEVTIADDYMQSLISRELMTDDYHTHDTLLPKSVFNYNGRVNIANVIRKVYAGYNPFSAFCWTDDGDSSTVTIYVEIARDGEKVIVRRDSAQEYNGQSLSLNFSKEGMVWFFYPDPNAKRAVIKIGGVCYEFYLTPHVGLNGAYWWHMDGLSTATSPVTEPTASAQPVLHEQNKIYTSEVNNPFFFPLTGINTVGTGEIIGICAAVRPMSQGQFGQYPLYAFTSEGVWALQTTSEGGYSSVQPITRDVCKDAAGITQLDDAVLFTTDRGIMLISGSTAQCISDTIKSDTPFRLDDLGNIGDDVSVASVMGSLAGISGISDVKPFSEFLPGCRMIYDYEGQRIIAYNPATGLVDGVSAAMFPYAYIYSLESHKWGMMQSTIAYAVNAYPDAMAVTSDNKLVNFSEPDKEGNVKAIIVTRPLTLGQPDILKTVDTVLNRGQFDYTGRRTAGQTMPLRTILFGSRDLYNWQLVASSDDHHLRGFRGTPYKWFRLALLLDLAPDESVTGATVQLQPRMINRQR